MNWDQLSVGLSSSHVVEYFCGQTPCELKICSVVSHVTWAVCLWKQSIKTFHSFQKKQLIYWIILKMTMDVINDDVNDDAVNDDDEIDDAINTTMILSHHTFSRDAY